MFEKCAPIVCCVTIYEKDFGKFVSHVEIPLGIVGQNFFKIELIWSSNVLQL